VQIWRSKGPCACGPQMLEYGSCASALSPDSRYTHACTPKHTSAHAHVRVNAQVPARDLRTLRAQTHATVSAVHSCTHKRALTRSLSRVDARDGRCGPWACLRQLLSSLWTPLPCAGLIAGNGWGGVMGTRRGFLSTLAPRGRMTLMSMTLMPLMVMTRVDARLRGSVVSRRWGLERAGGT